MHVDGNSNPYSGALSNILTGNISLSINKTVTNIGSKLHIESSWEARWVLPAGGFSVGWDWVLQWSLNATFTPEIAVGKVNRTHIWRCLPAPDSSPAPGAAQVQRQQTSNPGDRLLRKRI